MTMEECHAAMRVILNLNRAEMFAAKVFADGPEPWVTPSAGYEKFRAEKLMYFIQCDDNTKRRIWALVEQRTKR